MRKYLLSSIYLTLCGCSRVYTGVYYDSCTSYHKLSVSLTLSDKNDFTYNFIYNDTPIKGTWQRSHDTITLRSKTFLVPQEPLSPVIKYTTVDGVDRFTSVGKKLIPITDIKDAKKNCFLSKQQKAALLSLWDDAKEIAKDIQNINRPDRETKPNQVEQKIIKESKKLKQ